MGRRTLPCGSIAGRSSIWPVRSCLRSKVATHGASAIIFSKNHRLEEKFVLSMWNVRLVILERRKYVRLQCSQRTERSGSSMFVLLHDQLNRSVFNDPKGASILAGLDRLS